ncbi:concanavalin A-like lectin/glucanase domain-containing protein [Rhizophagus irregularis DAOM 181602=DAOM 197198]|nr:concanavalin A-like lectin/glucanase domain-containing protein [Rhizophagus irregularis DAOM 181602=DAOM 197198]
MVIKNKWCYIVNTTGKSSAILLGLGNGLGNIHILFQLEEILLLITTSFLGIWILISEIHEILPIGLNKYYEKTSFESNLEIFYNIFGIITIIPISIVFVAIRKRSKSLCILFNIASLIEIAIILSRLLWSFCKNYSAADDIPISDFIDIIKNDITYRERFFIVILNINTYLCYKRVDNKFISQKKEKKSESYEHLKKLNVNAWKFTTESRILLLNIVSINENIVSADNEIGNVDNDEVDEIKNIYIENIGVEHDNNISKKDHEIYFNAKSDVMMQTNYPLLNVNDVSRDTIALNMNTVISSQLSPSEEYWFLSSPSSQIKYWFYYYEITILSNPNNDKTIIAMGLATKKYPLNRLPGCNTHSVGFHSDEGRIFRNEKYSGSKYAEKWGEINNVVGCGYCPKTGQVFFTMNGNYLGIAYTSLSHNWYPTIGSNGVCSLKVNFGQKEFKYKEANGMSVAGIISQELLNMIDEHTKININP